MRRCCCLILAVAGLVLPCSICARAAATYLAGTVTSGGLPVAGATVEASGNNRVTKAITDSRGRFSFATLEPGQYVLLVSGPKGAVRLIVDLASAPADVTLELSALKTIGTTTVAGRGAAPPVSGSGTDLTLNASLLARSPGTGGFPSLLIQLPGAARGANGAVHLNGDHGDIAYVVDGVALPQQLNRIVGSEFDPADAAFVEVLEGAYPAQYGGKFAAVLNVSSRAGQGPPGYSAELLGGSNATSGLAADYHLPAGSGTLVVAARADQTARGMDPPDFDSPHNAASGSAEFVRMTLPRGNDYVNLTVSHAFHTYQIPNAVSFGEPAATDDNETQDDTFVSLQYHRALGTRGVLSFGPSYRRSQIRDFGDPLNDWLYGETLNTSPPPFGNGGTPNDCAASLAQSALFGPTTCGYSLSGSATASDYLFNADAMLRSGAHELHWGALYDLTTVVKRYNIVLQPHNYLAPVLQPGDPSGPYDVVDDAPNTGHTESAYVQDAWRMGRTFEFDYGLRFDTFDLSSTQFAQGFSMFSPRLKLVRSFGPRANVYAYYGRFFTPFSFENVSPAAAQLLNLPLQRTQAAFDLKPQRDSVYELGGHLPLGAGDLGWRIMQKDAADLLDDTQVGVTNLHQDINYNQGRIVTQTLYYQRALARGGRTYISFNHTYSVNRGCETQLLAPCFGSPADWTPADHMQQWGATGGLLGGDPAGRWWSLDGEYGSGLSSAVCPPATPGFCSMTPHLQFDALAGWAVARGATLTLGIDNLLNDRYYVTLLNAQGNHTAPGRTFVLSLRVSGR